MALDGLDRRGDRGARLQIPAQPRRIVPCLRSTLPHQLGSVPK